MNAPHPRHTNAPKRDSSTQRKTTGAPKRPPKASKKTAGASRGGTGFSKKAAGAPKGGAGIPKGAAGAPNGVAVNPQAQKGGNTLLSRRAFLYGAAGIGAVALVGGGVAAYSAVSSANDNKIHYLEAPEDKLTTLNEFTALDNYETKVELVAEHEAPYGTLLWMTDSSIAACLLPTETGSPLTQVALMNLNTGDLNTVLEEAVGAKERFEIYDVRATTKGIVWTEADVLDGSWRIYTAAVNGSSLGKPVMQEEGDEHYDTPMLAVAGNRAFWQVVPKSPTTDNLTSRLMSASFSSNDSTCVYECKRRMGTPPYSANDSVTIAPRVDSPTTYYQLTNIEATSGSVLDELILPSAMTPLEAGYGRNGFMFSFPDIYDYGGAISNLGTYTPLEKSGSGDYGSAKWFGFNRTPTAAPAWCNNLLIVKSSFSICGVDLDEKTYFAIDVDDGADTYGDYLATSGTYDTFVTYSNIDHAPVDEKPIHTCRVKVWKTAGAGNTNSSSSTGSSTGSSSDSSSSSSSSV